MDRTKFIDDLISSGAADDEIDEAVKLAESRGEFKKDNQPSWIAPKSMALPEDAPLGQKAGAVLNDALTLPGRAATSIPTFLGTLAGGGGAKKSVEEFIKDAANTGKSEQKGASGFAENMLREPGGMFPAMGAAKTTVQAVSKIPVAARLAQGVVRGAQSTVPYAVGIESGEVAEGRSVSPLRGVATVAGGGLGGGALAGGGAVIRGAGSLAAKLPTKKGRQALDEMAGMIVEEQTAIPEDVMRMAGTPEGMAMLKANKGKAYETGKKLVDAVYNPIGKFPESQKISATLEKLPPVDAEPVMRSLAAHITDNPSPEFKKTNDLISSAVSWIADVAEKNGGEITSGDIVGMQSQLDDIIADRFGKDSDKYITALKDARHAIRTSLLEAAEASGNPEYVDNMKTLADKMEIISKIKSRLGSDTKTGEGRAESFVRNLFSLGKTDLQETLKDFDVAFGTNITNEAYAAKLAENLNKKGELPYFTKWQTGRSGMLGTLGALTVGSPKVASKLLSVTGKMAGRENVIPANLTTAPADATGETVRNFLSLAEKKPDIAKKKLETILGDIAAKRAPKEGPEDAFPGMGDLIDPKEFKTRQKASEALGGEIDIDPDALDFNPSQLDDYESQMMRMADNAPEDAAAKAAREKTRLLTLNSLKNGIGYGSGKELPPFSKMKTSAAETIKATAEEINTKPEIWNHYYEKGVLDQPWNPAWTDGVNDAAISPDDLRMWMNEAGKRQQIYNESKGASSVSSFLKRSLGNERGEVGAVKNNGPIYHGGRDFGEDGVLSLGNAGRVGSGQDAGAVFVTPSKKYASGYVKSDNGRLYEASVDFKKENIFDAKNPKDIEKLSKYVDPQVISMIKETMSHDAADWATLSQFTDEIEEAGFTGAKFLERPAENIEQLVDGSFKLSGKPVYSYGFFHEVPAKAVKDAGNTGLKMLGGMAGASVGGATVAAAINAQKQKKNKDKK